LETSDLKVKLAHLTVDGARDFWNEIEEWLTAMAVGCQRKYDRAKTIDEFKEAQILKRLCERMKKLPDNMVIYLREQIAEPSPDDEKREEKMLNFLTEPYGVKHEEE